MSRTSESYDESTAATATFEVEIIDGDTAEYWVGHRRVSQEAFVALVALAQLGRSRLR